MLIIIFHGKLVVLNVLSVPYEQHGWLSWAVAAAPSGPGLLTTAGRWLFVGVMGQPCHVGSSGRNRRPIQCWWPSQAQVELSFAILYTLFPCSWGPSSHVLNWRRTSSSIETTVTGKKTKSKTPTETKFFTVEIPPSVERAEYLDGWYSSLQSLESLKTHN